MIFDSGTASIMDIAGFDTGFSLSYSSTIAPGSFSVFDSLGGTGNLLASGTLAPLSQSGPGDPTGAFAFWKLVPVTLVELPSQLHFLVPEIKLFLMTSHLDQKI